MTRETVTQLKEIVVCGRGEPNEQGKCVDPKKEKDTSRQDKDRGGDDRNESSKQRKTNSNRTTQPQNNSNKPQSKPSPVATKPKLSIDTYPHEGIAIEEAANIIFPALGLHHLLSPMSTQLPVPAGAMMIRDKINQKGLNTFIVDMNKVLAAPQVGDAALNMKAVFIEHYLVQKAQKKPEWQETFDAVNTVMGAYEEVYKKTDVNLAKQYQTLTRNFRYSPKRVADAQKRYAQFMNGKKFKISKGDQEILDKIIKMGNTADMQKSVKKVKSVANFLGGVGKLLTISDLFSAFSVGQKTGNWNQFGAVLGATSAGMLISGLVALATAPVSVPSAVVIATIGGIASYHFADEKLWSEIIDNTQRFLEKR